MSTLRPQSALLASGVSDGTQKLGKCLSKPLTIKSLTLDCCSALPNSANSSSCLCFCFSYSFNFRQYSFFLVIISITRLRSVLLFLMIGVNSTCSTVSSMSCHLNQLKTYIIHQFKINTIQQLTKQKVNSRSKKCGIPYARVFAVTYYNKKKFYIKITLVLCLLNLCYCIIRLK
ncbi:hypothetical protein AGLY_009392 [Aphis glycines]|uniref:Uncharacterized protein n=1 Tax=Aphis glycines TaxID=307491 RepID=A0A6G0TJH6_APHGL|nr:hypothetical protein AGLY_009392 [Aphis glycines]